MAGHDLSPFARFVSDVRRSLRIWQKDPRLPLTALALAMFEATWYAVATTTGETWLSVFGMAVAILFAGFYGTVRFWYVAVDRDLPLTWTDVRGLTRHLWRRYIALGIYFVILMIPTTILATALSDDHSLARTLLFFATVVVLDVALTFATVTLAFHDGTAGAAVRHSIRVVRAEWPSCASYVLVPPLALQLTFRVLPRDTLNLPTLLVLSLATAMVALVCKGATVLFYADRYPTLRDDAAPSTGVEDSWG